MAHGPDTAHWAFYSGPPNTGTRYGSILVMHYNESTATFVDVARYRQTENVINCHFIKVKFILAPEPKGLPNPDLEKNILRTRSKHVKL